ncbi:hypothetical protein NNC19_07335 [Clostridium sp. SHJSY1]|uniref:hypothetical protein n=1 Tax=Clostridium sp. SHJSY1 TaxID=2942483 RepID=UPI0028744975|nr:hypothetical protein [Clostridium sp. SHJSY1]MDS0525487.1 hypothetical protein [Clostridium sp. SHJSY1]
MDKYKIEKLMEQRGFTLWATLGGKNYQFLSKDHSKPIINCLIYPETKEFEFKYLIEFDIVQLILPKCSPYDNEKHFANMLNRFMKQVDKLQ